MSTRPTPYEKAYYQKLVGRQITGIRWEDFEGQALPVLVLSGKDREGNPATAAVMCDPDGNGPGHLDHEL